MKNYTIKNGILVRKRNKLSYGAYGTACKVRDVAFAFRMGAGFAGAVNTSHPANIRGFLKDATNPPTFFGQPVMINASANSVRAVLDTDRTGGATDVFGVVVRPYPFLGSTAPTNAYAGTGSQSSLPWGGNQLPDGAVDVLLMGNIMVYVNGTPSNGSVAYIWTANNTSPHTLGGWEASNPATSGFAITWDKTQFGSPPDASGIAELRFNV